MTATQAANRRTTLSHPQAAVCTKGGMAHRQDAEDVCPTCTAGLQRERLHVNPEARRRAAGEAVSAVHAVADVRRGAASSDEVYAWLVAQGVAA